MELTAWQRFCNRILGGVLKKRARKDTELSENLVKGSMGIMPEVYLATVIFTSFAIADPRLKKANRIAIKIFLKFIFSSNICISRKL